MKYFILEYGHTINPSNPGFKTLAEARVALKADAREMLAHAKRRWKGAFMFTSETGCAVHAMKDRQSPLWGALTIIQS